MSVADVADRAFQNKYWSTSDANRWVIRRERALEHLTRAREVARVSKRLEVKPHKNQYVHARKEEARALTQEQTSRWRHLENLLKDSLATPPGIDVVNLRAEAGARRVPPQHLTVEAPKPQWQTYAPGPAWELIRHVPLVKRLYTLRTDAADRHMKGDLRAWNLGDEYRKKRLAAEEAQIELEIATERQQVDADNDEMDTFRERLALGDTPTVEAYFDAVMRSLVWPEEFPDRHRVTYNKRRSQLSIEMFLPTRSVVPRVRSYEYDEAGNRMKEKPIESEELLQLYRSVVAQTTLRVLRELFGADDFRLVSSIDFEGRAETIDESTGQPVEPYLVSLTAEVSDFQELRLELVDPVACLRVLAA